METIIANLNLLNPGVDLAGMVLVIMASVAIRGAFKAFSN